MSTTVKQDLAGLKVLGFDTLILTDGTTTNFDFGTPNDIDLSTNANYAPGDRVLVAFAGRAAAAQTTDAITWIVQDADDSSGSIGTPATAVTSVVEGALVGAVTEDVCVLAVTVQNGRPWIRCSGDMQGTSDDYHVSCTVFAVPTDV